MQQPQRAQSQPRGRSQEPVGARRTSSARRGTSSRDSSVSSEVRCGCQYFQTDSLLPERLARAGRPTSRTAFTSSPTGTMTTTARTMGDHEYEPISPPPDIRMIDPDEPEIDVRKGSTGSQEQQPPDTELADKEPGFPADGEMEDAAMGGREVIGESNEAENENDSLSAQELNKVFEERFLANTPTTESRTDCEINTSQVDSSGLEDLPLKRGARKKSGNGGNNGASSSMDLQTRARGLQIRLRSQAGRIREKLKSVPKPSFERPKFNFPERPKFNLPDRPKFSFPDRPKFHLPERPKFNLPERPKFNIQRPKLPSLPSSVSSTISKQKSRFLSTRRPLRERSTTNPSSDSTASSKRNIFSLRSYPRIFDKKRKSREFSSSKSTRSQTPPPKMLTKKRGSMGARWLNKFKGRSNENGRNDFEVDEYVPADKPTYHMDPETVVVREIPLKDEHESVENIESVEVERKFPHSSALEENILKMKQAQMQRSQSQIASDAEQRSSGSSSERHRAGVLEEIDSDEFFLREKGLSQEDVEMGRYLTSEIRDAFRPPVSSLSQIESYPKEQENDLALQYRGTPEREPIRPTRRSLKKKPSEDETESEPIKTESEPIQIEESPHYYNFPPIRPKRMKKSFKQESEEQEEYDDNEKDEEDMDDEEIDISSKQDSYVLEENQPLKLKTPSLIITNTDEYSLPHIEGMEDEEPMDDEGEWADEEERDYEEDEKAPSPPLPATPPLPPKRYRRSRKEHYEATFNGHYTKEDWLENVDNNIVPEDIMALRMESDFIMPANQMHGYYDSPPVPPKRERKKSSRTTSLADEDRTSRGADSLPFERDQELLADKYLDDIPFADIPSEDYQELPTERYIGSRERVNKVVSEEISRSEPHLKNEYDLGDLGGYATVEKTYPKPVQRQKKEKNGRPAPPVRRKKIGGHNFFSWPRKTMHTPPQRPRRNYSTLGPARPPRRRSSSLQSESYMEIEDHDSHEGRNLQSGDVIEKMKSRPLPPPPRPPRRGREDRYLFDEQDYTEDLNIEKEFAPMAALRDSVFYSHERTISNEKIEQIDDLIPHPEEVSIAIQTDPVPDDFYIEDLEYSQERPPITADAYTETTKQEIVEISPSSPTPEEQYSIKTEKDEHLPSIEEPYTESIIPKSFISPQESLPPPTIIERQIPVFIQPESGSEVDVLRTNRLQVGELDVSRINVGELQAQKIVVSDIDGVSMSINELTSKSGHLIINGMELPSSVLQEMKEIKDAIAAIRLNAPSQPTIYISSSQTQTSEISETNELSASQISDATIESIKEIPSKEKDLEKQSSEKSEQKIHTEDKSPREKISKESEISHETISSSDKQSIPLEHDYQLPEPSVNIQQPSTSQSTAQEKSAEVNYQIPPGYIPTPGSIPPFTNPIFISSIDTLLPDFYRGLHAREQHRTASSPELESDEEYVYIPGHRRRRHKSKAVKRSSSDEESSQINQPRRLRHQDEQNVMELTRQFVRVVHGNSQKAVTDLVKFISSHLPESEDDRRDIQRGLFILFILLTGLFILGFGSEKTVHYHHWDYTPPP